MKQKLNMFENEKKEIKNSSSKRNDIEAIKKQFEEQTKILNNEIRVLKFELNEKDKALQILNDKTKMMEISLETLKNGKKSNNNQKINTIKNETHNEQFQNLQKSLASNEKTIEQLKQNIAELEEIGRQMEQENEELKRYIQLKTESKNNNNAPTRQRNSYETLGVMRGRIMKLEGDLIQKEVKIEALQQKMSYFKQKETNAKRVKDNLNEFHKDLFNSFNFAKRK